MYQQVAADIRAQVKAGVLKAGDKLPSTRELCDHYSVSVTVIRFAMLQLRTEGIVEGRAGVGVFVKN
jgi:GntR family transcriptional regulator